MPKVPQGLFYRSPPYARSILLKRYVSDAQILKTFLRRPVSECLILSLGLDSETTESLNSLRTQLYGAETPLFKSTHIWLFSNLPIEQLDLYVNIMRRICTSRQRFPLGRGHPLRYFMGSGVALRIDSSTALLDMYNEILEGLRGKISIKELAVPKFHFKQLSPFQYHLSVDEIKDGLTTLVSKYPYGLNLGYPATLVLTRQSEQRLRSGFFRRTHVLKIPFQSTLSVC